MKSESVSASVIFTLPRLWSSVISPFSITKRSLSSVSYTHLDVYKRQMEDVASSRISIGGSVSMMREMHKSCFCPAERLPPSSPICRCV